MSDALRLESPCLPTEELSFAEIDRQRPELLPARTVLSTFGGFRNNLKQIDLGGLGGVIDGALGALSIV